MVVFTPQKIEQNLFNAITFPPPKSLKRPKRDSRNKNAVKVYPLLKALPDHEADDPTSDDDDLSSSDADESDSSSFEDDDEKDNEAAYQQQLGVSETLAREMSAIEDVSSANDGSAHEPALRHFQSWLERNSYISRTANANNRITHKFMKGFVLNIPEHEMKRLRALIEFDYSVLLHGTPTTYCLSETIRCELVQIEGYPDAVPNPSVPVHIFAELVVEEKDLWPTKYQNEVAHIFVRTLSKHMKNAAPFNVYVSTMRDNVRSYSNVHLQTQICVPAGAIPFVYHHYMTLLNRFLPRGTDEQPWELMVDTHVIRNGEINLRTNWSNSIVDCNACKTGLAPVRVRDQFLPCRHNLRCINGSMQTTNMYCCVQVLDRYGNQNVREFTRVSKSKAYELEATSIRPKPGTPYDSNFYIPLDCPPPLYFERVVYEDKLKYIKNKAAFEMLQKETIVRLKGKKQKQWEAASAVPPDSNAFRLIQDEINEIKPEYWGQVQIKEVKFFHNPDTKWRTYVIVSKSGCHICLNRTKNSMNVPAHTKTTVFWEMTVRGTTQMCNGGPKMENRVSQVPCHDFRSIVFPLKKKERREMLFPEAKSGAMKLLKPDCLIQLDMLAAPMNEDTATGLRREVSNKRFRELTMHSAAVKALSHYSSTMFTDGDKAALKKIFQANKKQKTS